MGNRLNWANRQNPGEFDETAPPAVTYEFDHRRNTLPGSDSWPKGFGPSTIGKAWRNGLVVVAEIQSYPHPVAVVESRWGKGIAGRVLEVRDQGRWHVPDRLYTRTSVKGLSSTGEIK